MNRPKKEDFKVEYIKGVAEICSVTKQYSIAQDNYIDYLEQLITTYNEKVEEAYSDGFNDSRYDFDLDNYIEHTSYFVNLHSQVEILKKTIDKLMVTFDDETDRMDYILDIVNEYKRQVLDHCQNVNSK